MEDWTETGRDKYLTRQIFEDTTPISRYLKGQSIGGGRIGAGTIIELGSQYIKIDGRNKRIIINDGTNDIGIIGYQKGGF